MLDLGFMKGRTRVMWDIGNKNRWNSEKVIYKESEPENNLGNGEALGISTMRPEHVDEERSVNQLI